MKITKARVEHAADALWEASKLKGTAYHNTRFSELNEYLQKEWRRKATITVRAFLGKTK